MAKIEEFTINTGTGRTADVFKIDEEWKNHITKKGYMGDYPKVGNYAEYEPMGDGYVIYDKDFVEAQLEGDMER